MSERVDALRRERAIRAAKGEDTSKIDRALARLGEDARVERAVESGAIHKRGR